MIMISIFKVRNTSRKRKVVRKLKKDIQGNDQQKITYEPIKLVIYNYLGKQFDVYYCQKHRMDWTLITLG